MNIEEHLKNVTHNRKRINESLEKESGDIRKYNDRIKAGDLVMFKSEAKGLLKKRYIGPCTVIEILPYDNVKLQYSESHLIRNINQLKRGKIKLKSDYNDIEISV